MGRDWIRHLVALIHSVRDCLLISSPYITSAGCGLVSTALAANNRKVSSVSILTDLSPLAICQGANDPEALRALFGHGYRVDIYHLPRLHAKVYVADTHTAIVTSGNLTSGGLVHNFEYGICVSEPTTVLRIHADITAYSRLGAPMSNEHLTRYCEVADEVRAMFRRSQAAINRSVRRRLASVVREAEDELIRLRLAGGAMHTVFAKTILYLLRSLGPLTTVEIHMRIEAIHPDLCDNTVDRIIDGKHFGKKWKHAVRTAQQQLKKQGVIELRGDCWRLTSE